MTPEQSAAAVAALRQELCPGTDDIGPANPDADPLAAIPDVADHDAVLNLGSGGEALIQPAPVGWSAEYLRQAITWNKWRATLETVRRMCGNLVPGNPRYLDPAYLAESLRWFKLRVREFEQIVSVAKPPDAKPNTPSIPKPSRRGRKPTSDPAKDAAFQADWLTANGSGVTLKEFCSNRGKTLKEARSVFARIRSRTNRAVKRKN